MPSRRVFDKKNATTYTLVHRAQNDPLIHSDAPQMVLAEAGATSHVPYQPSSQRKIKQRGDLEDEFGSAFGANEGQAAEYGVYYDDTRYDYMQHLRDLGQGAGDGVFVEAKFEKKGKGKQRLEDALAGLELQSQGASSVAESRASSLFPEDMLPSEFVRRTTYQDQQDVPDAIAGFRPDMDPRLREALEALEDEAYVQDQEEDFFAELAGDGEEVDADDFEYQTWGEGETGSEDRMQAFLTGQDDDDQGWESDDTVKAANDATPPTQLLPPDDPNAIPAATNTSWMSEYSAFKQTGKLPPAAAAAAAAAGPAPGAEPSLASEDRSLLSSLAPGRRKKRKGARTSTTNYSMTSSALARTEPMGLLDARFDRLMEAYGEDGDIYDDDDEGLDADESVGGGGDAASTLSGASRASGVSRASGMSRASTSSRISTYSRMTDGEAPKLVRADFEGIMDGFLEGQTRKGGRDRRDVQAGLAPGRKGKRGAGGEGLRELEEIRRGLGKVKGKGKGVRV